MWKRIVIIAAVIACAAGGYWYLSQPDALHRVAALEASAGRLIAQEASKNFSAPPPIVATSTASADYTLTRAGVVADTNTARRANGGLAGLSENAALDNIAALRLKDMFTNQYFAHVSPASSSAEVVAETVGYDYIELGENLALGNFDGDQGVLSAWMKSPGHRANILNTHYTQIGVAVGEGNFEGQDVWIAVQVFGRPASDCPAPETALKAEIDAAQLQILRMQVTFQTMQAQLNHTTVKYGTAYDQMVTNYNTVVEEYNQLVTKMKAEIAQYNIEVDAYNQCLAD